MCMDICAYPQHCMFCGLAMLLAKLQWIEPFIVTLFEDMEHISRYRLQDILDMPTTPLHQALLHLFILVVSAAILQLLWGSGLISWVSRPRLKIEVNNPSQLFMVQSNHTQMSNNFSCCWKENANNWAIFNKKYCAISLASWVDRLPPWVVPP